MTDKRAIRVFETAEELNQEAAQRFVALTGQSVASGQPLTVALAGGSTPAGLYRLLATPHYRDQIRWEHVHLFFGDERCVPPDGKDSNFQMVHADLLSRMPDPIRNVHRMPADLPDHDLAAQQYAEELHRFFKIEPGQRPRFDLILLGMGPDGHTASLFPHKPALREQQRLVVATEPGLAPFVPRLTLTYPVLNNAANVLFLVEHEDKAATVARVLEGPTDPEGLPSQSVQPTCGTLTWFLDRAAASQLKNI
jgi:6-phosphogluconolactonase